MERVSLNQNALKVEFTEQLSEHCPLVVFTGGIAGLADRHAQGSGVERHLGNERRTTRRGGLYRASQSLAIADKLVETAYTTWDLGDCPVPDGGAGGRHVHLAEEVAEG